MNTVDKGELEVHCITNLSSLKPWDALGAGANERIHPPSASSQRWAHLWPVNRVISGISC